MVTFPNFDPLRIHCIPVLASDDPSDVTPFQGFSRSFGALSWAFELIASLPADVLERTNPIDEIIAQRMGGIRSIAWAPINIKALEDLEATELGAFVILFTGEKDCAERVATWARKQSHPILHVSPHGAEGACAIAEFSTEMVRAYCIEALKKTPDMFSAEEREAAETALPKWAAATKKTSGLKFHGHNITKPNYMSLYRSSRTIEPGEPFVGLSEKEYTKVILQSANAIAKVREEIGLRSYHALTLLRPLTLLVEPALFRPNYKRIRPKGAFEEKAVTQTLRWIQT